MTRPLYRRRGCESGQPEGMQQHDCEPARTHEPNAPSGESVVHLPILPHQHHERIMSDQTHEDMGALKQAVTTLTSEVALLRNDMAQVNKALSELRGGKKALWALLGAAGFLGGLVSWVEQHVKLS